MTPRIILALVMFVIAGGFLTWRAIGTGKGQHAAPRRYVHDDDMPTAVIDRVATKHAPPWDRAPFTSLMRAPEPAPVIEPAAVLPPPPAWNTVPALLPAPVAELLGHDSTDDAVAAMSGQWHSVESLFTRAMTRQVNEKLSKDAP